MKLKMYALAFSCLLLFTTTALKAQHCAGASGSGVCTPNTSLTTVGFFPPYDSLPCAVIGSAYDQIVQFHTPPTVTQNGSTYNLNWVRIDTVSNLPCGLCWRSGTSNNQINGNATGCIRVTGTTFDAPGQYKLRVIVSANVQVGLFGFTVTNQNAESLGLRYYVRVADLSGTCQNVDTLAAGRTTTSTGSITALTITGPSSVCSGQTAALSINAANYYAYKWSTGAITSSINVSSSGTYTVTAYAACTSVTASKTVTVNPAPTASITPATATICSGSSVTLTASGGASYLWSNGANTAATTVSPTSATTYTVTVTSAASCTATASRLVNVNPAPTASISPSSVSICTGASATLTAGGGTSYVWNTTATTSAITVSPTGTTTYTVTATDANSCTASASRQVTVNPLPAASISPATSTICAGSSATLTASGGTGYSWSTTATTAAITVSPSNTTTYSVTVTDANSCSASTSRIVNVNPVPTVSVNPSSATVCGGVTTILSSSSANSYSWSNGSTTQNIAVSPSNTTTYTVTAFDQNNCSASASSVITVNQAPTASISPASAAICAGNSTTLTASGGLNYVWNDNSTNAVLNVSPQGTTTYTVTVTAANLCTATASAIVTVNQLPVAGITPSQSSICTGSSVTLTANGGSNYLWSDNSTANTLSVSPSQDATYSVTVTDANLCSATASASVTVNSAPSVSIQPTSQTICSGNSVTLIANGSGSYSWSTGSSNPVINVSPTSTTTYTVTVTNANNCTATASASVTVNANPNATIAASTDTICNGSSVTLTASSGASYVWNNNSSNAVLTASPTANTTYSVTVTDANNCSSTASQEIAVINVATTLQASGPTTFCAGGSVTLDAGAGFDSYNWSSGETTQTITVSNSGSFTCTVTQSGCSGVSNTVNVVETSNTLSPVIAAAPSLEICPGGTATLDAGAGYDTYTWSTTEITQSISTATAGNYTVTVTLGACSGTANAQVAVGNFPVKVDITPSDPVTACPGTAVSFDAGTGYDSYSWSNGSSAQSIQPTTAGEYIITVTKDFCTGSDTAQLNFYPAPVASISPSTASVCLGSSTTLTASAASSYLWSDNTGSSTLIVAPTTATTYSVTITDANQCTASASVNVTVNTLPVAVINPATITSCAGQPFTFTASGGNSYLWSDASTNAQLSGTAQNSGNYTVTVTDVNQCTASTSAGITVNQLPAAAITPSQPAICNGQSITLTANGNGTYAWSGGSNSNTITVSPTTSTSYSLTVTDANNCSASTSTTVSVTTINAVITANGPTNFCSGNSVTLSAPTGADTYTWSNGAITDNVLITSSGTYNCTITQNSCSAVSNDITVTVTPASIVVSVTASPSLNICQGGVTVLDAGTGFDTYQWSNGSITHLSATDSAGTYTVTVTQNGCAATAAATVNVGNFAVNAAINPSGAQACSGDSILLDAGSNHNTYAWSNGASSQQLFVLQSGTYTVTVTDENACSGTATSSVLFNSRPQPSILPAGNQAICTGQSITLSADAVYDTYLWSNGTTTQSAVVSAAGSYSLTVTQNGCSGYTSSPVQLTLNPLPAAAITPAASTVCSGGSTTLTANGGTSYLWNDQSTSTTLNVTPTNLTTYTVTVTDANNCSASAASTVAITPSPAVSIISSETSNIICQGTSLQLFASGGSSYVWSTNETSASISSTPANTTTYSVTVTDGNNCSGSAAQTVVVNPLPQPSVSVTQVNGGANYVLQATPAGLTSYIWQQAVANDTTNQLHFNYGTNLDTFMVNCVSGGGYYRVLVTDANGCSAPSSYAKVPFCTAINEIPQLLHFALMPNPATDRLNVVYDLKEQLAVKIAVLDITGRVVMELTTETESAGKHTKTLDLNGLAQGLYLLNFNSNNSSFNTRFIKE
ncbi:MAG: T9SS type A sorting domain-containing protein [Chitinophagales bacterium]